MRSITILVVFSTLFSVGLMLGSWNHLQSQALPADVFSMPLGYRNGLAYKPTTNTSYNVMNPGLVDKDGQDIITCFDIAWTQIYPGYVVIIKHDDPFDDSNNPKPVYSVYGHLDEHSVIVQNGDFVSRGQVLGAIRFKDGNDSHLHFEIRYFEGGGNIYPNYPKCNNKTGKAGVGYTYPEHPDDFPSPGMGYTDPLAFIKSRSGLFLPLVHKDPPVTPTPTPTWVLIPTPTPTPTPTPIPCVTGRDLVQNGDFDNIAQQNLWVSNPPGLIYAYLTTPAPNYGLLMGHENNNVQTVYEAITVPPGVSSVDIKFWLYVRTNEWLSYDFDYLFVDVISGNDATGASLSHEPFAPFTNRFTPQGAWQ